MVKTRLSYKDAGVDIQAGNELVDRIKPFAAKTHRPGILGGIGGFGALFEIPFNRFKRPVLVSSTDGVGTKLKLAIDLNIHDTIGIDLVAMCANDVIVQGAEPLFFLDYFATGKLDLIRAEQIIRGISEGCLQAKIALIGGETAEMPGMYAREDYDLAGFVVGIVEKEEIICGKSVLPNDVLIALPSSGLHSNGFSLVRKIIEVSNQHLTEPFDRSTLGEVLLTPTKIYVQSILKLLESVPVKAMAHITGGGLVENLPRVLPKWTKALIDQKTWQMPKIFSWLKSNGDVDDQEMWRTFNCGVGMVICVSKTVAKTAVDKLQSFGEQPWIIGEIKESQQEKPTVSFL